MPKVKVLEANWIVDGVDVYEGHTYEFPEATVARLTTGRGAEFFQRVKERAKTAPQRPVGAADAPEAGAATTTATTDEEA